MSVREAAESSRTREQAEPKPERKWVALLSAPVLLSRRRPPPPTQTPMEHAFPRGTHVRLSLTEGEGLVEARDNGRGVVLGTWGTMPQTAWIVDYEQREGKPYMLLRSSAYGRYLAHKGVLDGRTVSATGTMVDYFHPEQEELLWEFRMKQGTGGQGNFLNAKYGPWNVSSEPETVWKLKAILWTPTPPRPLSPPVTAEEYGKLRKIVLFQADDAGEFNENHWNMFEFEGNSLPKLRTEVLQQRRLQTYFTGLRQPHENNVNSLCVRPGSYGRLTPLATDLPRSVEPMHIVVLTYGSPAAAAIRTQILMKSRGASCRGTVLKSRRSVEVQERADLAKF